MMLSEMMFFLSVSCRIRCQFCIHLGRTTDLEHATRSMISVFLFFVFTLLGTLHHPLFAPRYDLILNKMNSTLIKQMAFVKIKDIRGVSSIYKLVLVFYKKMLSSQLLTSSLLGCSGLLNQRCFLD